MEGRLQNGMWVHHALKYTPFWWEDLYYVMYAVYKKYQFFLGIQLYYCNELLMVDMSKTDVLPHLYPMIVPVFNRTINGIQFYYF